MRIPGWLFFVGTLAFVALTGVCAFVSFAAARQVAIDLQAQGVDTSLISFRPNSVPATATSRPSQTPTPTPTLLPGETPEPTEAAPTPTRDPLAEILPPDPRRITILLLGVDQRTGVAEVSNNTDTLMLVSIDPGGGGLGVLSIPRDLWVDIPGFLPARINTAYAQGEAGAYPGGGGALAMATVEANLGVEIDHYILFNFSVFTTVVDTIAPSGIEVCIDEAILDDHYPDEAYGTITVQFDPGCQQLDSTRLLQYARTRATFGGDFDRARRQQQVIQAAREELLSAGGIANFITQIPTVWDQLADNYETSLSLDELLQIAVLVQDIPRENMRFEVIDTRHTLQGTSIDGTQQILIPQSGAIRFVLQQTFNPPEDLTLADLRDRSASENASIVVYNNTDIVGFAGQMREWLTSREVIVTSVGNMPALTNANTTIRDYTGRPWTARYLAALLGLPEDRIVSGGGDGLTSADIMIVLGPDVQPLLSSNGG